VRTGAAFELVLLVVVLLVVAAAVVAELLRLLLLLQLTANPRVKPPTARHTNGAIRTPPLILDPPSTREISRGTRPAVKPVSGGLASACGR